MVSRNAILKLMPYFITSWMVGWLNGWMETEKRSKKKLSIYPTINKLSNLKAAYTLIELMIVVSLIGLAIGLITVSYLTFERRQRVRNAALELKDNIKYAQNKALSGDKGFGGEVQDFCSESEVLAGWYVRILSGAETYSIAGDCVNPAAATKPERKFGEKIYKLPKDVSIVGLNAGDEATILFRPLSEKATFHVLGELGAVDFLDDGGALQPELPLTPNKVIVELKGPSPYRYQVTVLPTGQVSENKIVVQ